MLDLILDLLDHAQAHAHVVALTVLLAAASEALFGVGVLVPGESVVVLAATALAGTAWLPVLVVAAWTGAAAGDQIGFAIGRASGPSLGRSRIIGRLGRHRWESALALVERRPVSMIGARLLPGVRTLVAPAAGASSLSRRRFLLTSAAATLLRSLLWVLGGATLGRSLIVAADRLLWALPALAALVLAVTWLRPRRRAHAAARQE